MPSFEIFPAEVIPQSDTTGLGGLWNQLHGGVLLPERALIRTCANATQARFLARILKTAGYDTFTMPRGQNYALLVRSSVATAADTVLRGNQL